MTDGFRKFAPALAAVAFTSLGLVCGYVAARPDAATVSTEPADAHDHAAGDAHEHADGEAHDHGATHEPHAPDLSPTTLENLGVAVAEVRAERFERTRAVAARITAMPEAERPLYAPIDGIVERLHVHTGGIVRAGDEVAGIVRASLPRARLEMTADVLHPAKELRHEAFVEFKRARGELQFATTELERIQALTGDGTGDELPLVPRERAIELRYTVARAQMALDHAQHELERHGLAPEQVSEAIDSGHLPEFTGEMWRRALDHNGLWPAPAERLHASLPEQARQRPWVVATIGELAAHGRLDPATVAWLADHAERVAPHFETIGAMLRDGATTAEVERQLALGALDARFVARAPGGDEDPADWDVTSIDVRVGATIAAGQALATLRDHRRMWLIAEPVGTEVADLAHILETRRSCRAVPLVPGDGLPELEVQIDALHAGRAIAVVANQVLHAPTSGDDAGPVPMRTWALRPGQRYTLHVPHAEPIDDAVILPVDALVTEGSKSIVFVTNARNEHFIPAEIRVLYRDATHVVLPSTGTGSLAPGARVVTHGALALQLALREPDAADADAGHGHSH